MMRIALALAVCVGVVHCTVDSFDTCKGDYDAAQADANAREVAGDGAGPGGKWKLVAADAKCAAGKGWKGDSTATTSLNTGTGGVGSDAALLALWVAVCCEDCVAGTNYSDADNRTQACTSCQTDPPSTCPAGQGKKCLANANTDCVACDVGTNYSLLDDNSACIACESCGAGFKVTTACIANTKTVCTACPAGEQRETVDNGAATTTCTACDFGSACAVGKGVVCDPAGDGSTVTCEACADGYHSNVTTQTVACAACQALAQDCAKGKGLVHCSKDGDGSNAACTACADGFFSDVSDKTSVCKAHNACTDNGVKTAGTAEADAVCNEASPAAKIATGLTSLLAVLLLLL